MKHHTEVDLNRVAEEARARGDEDVLALVRFACFERDQEIFDATDFAHPAWWRGHDYVSARFVEALDKARDEARKYRQLYESLCAARGSDPSV